MYLLHGTSVRAVVVALLCLSFNALAESPDPRGNVVSEKPMAAQAEIRTKIQAVTEKVAVRKAEILAENEAAAKLNAEIEGMAKDMQEIAEAMAAKQVELDKLLQADKAMAELTQERAKAYESLRVERNKMREQRIKRRREQAALPSETPAEADDGKSGEGETK
ncbi:MAG: hypothetical protein ACOX9C_02660 [Kiritimatiellia bacterium]